MKGKNSVYIIFTMSFILIVAAFLTIGASLSTPNGKSVLKWNVYISDVASPNKFIVDDDTLIYNVKLSDSIKEQEISFNIYNKGLINATLYDIVTSDLNKIKIGNINLSDLVDITYKNIDKESILNKNDIKKASILIKVKDNLDSDKLNILKQGINTNLNITLNYK